MGRSNQRERQRKIKGKRWWGSCIIYRDNKKKERESGEVVEKVWQYATSFRSKVLTLSNVNKEGIGMLNHEQIKHGTTTFDSGFGCGLIACWLTQFKLNLQIIKSVFGYIIL